MSMRLKEARLAAGLTQEKVAEELGIDIRYYKAIEYGERLGSIPVWDQIEDLFGIPQRELRRDTGDNRS